MLIKINGLIIRDTAYGESDKMLTVLTAERGKISVTGKGVRSQKSVLRVSAHIMFYGELTLYERGDRLWLREAAEIRDFYDVSLGLEALSLVAYVFDVINEVCVDGEDESALLRLTLNTLHMICEKKRSLPFIKAVFELRCAAEAGFAPLLDGECALCGKKGARCLDYAGGSLICAACADRENRGTAALPADVISALRHVVSADPARIFAFRIDTKAAENFYEACERYLTAQLDRLLPTLTYLRSVFPDTKTNVTDER
ncbi:MAG: DNA repair protein RecO [Eubacteriales bacterium]|jgi:DNA repair protein RecO (recombination protein O)|nr:DNA repair protein RecO [Eubacteriales bacterium]